MQRTPVATDPRRARRWLGGLLVVAVLSTAGSFEAWSSPSGSSAAVGFLLSAVLAVLSTVQAARLLAALQPGRSRRRRLTPPSW